MAFITSDRYKEVIYSGDAKHQLRLTFGGVELEDADYYCEKLTVTSRVLPTGGKIFTLDNFIAKEATLILHDIMGNENVPELKNPVVISIETLVDNEYEEVPIGVFNIQDTPTTDNGKTTIKLRDNAVLFDFPYNPYPLMEEASKDSAEENVPEENPNEIVWDGNTEGKEPIIYSSYNEDWQETQEFKYYPVSSKIISTPEELLGSRMVISTLDSESGEFVDETIEITEDLLVPDVFVTSTDNYLTFTLMPSIPMIYSIKQDCEMGSKGLYFYKGEEPETPMFVKGLYLVVNETAVVSETAEEDKETIVETKAVTASKAQILQDICDEAGVTNKVGSFLFEDEQTGFVDSAINARVYISYLAEQAGSIATIDRDGSLIFINRDNLVTQEIPFHLVEKYTIGERYTVSRTIYEDAIRRFEAGNDTADDLFINTANPYISSQEQIDAINAIATGFSIDSLNTGKIIGNPAIDAYDLISIQIDEETTYATLGNNTLTYNGVMINNFDTQIGIEERTQNVFINDDTSFQRWAKTEIDNANARITFQTAESQKISQDLGEIKDDLANNYYQKDYVNNLVIEASSGVTNTFSEAGGNNILRNTNFSATEVLEEGQDYEYWFGKLTRQSDSNAVNGFSAMLKNGNLYQEQQVANGQYTLSFYYKKTNPFANVLVRVNGKEYELTETENFTLFQTGIKDSETGEYITDPIIVGTNFLKVEFITDIDDSCVIYDIMCNVGTVRLAYSQNANESTTDTVNISKGITITSSVSNIKFVANYNGIYTLPKNSSVGKADSITEFTDKGMKTKSAVVENEAQIVGILRQRVGDQIWDSMIV